MRYIKRCYRLTREQDKKVKRIKRLAKDKSESGVIRDLIDKAA